MNNKEKMNESEMKDFETQVEKKVTKAVTIGVTVLIQAAIVFGITIVVLKFIWGWVVPDLFPGAVAQGLIIDELSWNTSVKFALFAAIVTGVNDSFKEAFKKD